MRETTDARAGRPDEETELFQAAELERMGLLPAGSGHGAGELFVGDGVHAEGWYRAWAGGGFTVVTCDFTMLRDTLFSIDTCRYLTVRGPASGGTAHSAATGPAAIAYIETREGRVSTPIPAGSRFSYAEVEYFEGALRDAFAQIGKDAIGEISTLLTEMRGGMSWAPGVLSALDAIACVDSAVPGAALIYEGATKMLLGSLVETATAALPKERDARIGVLAAIEFANERWREGASQQEAASVAGMGLTKFKRLFQQVTGYPWGAYLTTRRMREAKGLLASGRTVAETAERVGYLSPTSFSAAFARAFGMSPQQFKSSSAAVAMELVSGTTDKRCSD